ncbi:hypothetical protein RM863_29300 [Streptomyces sp. DSM 41014]|uniref:Uncharacterized protein n=1 Tax=Streptomyces hintoniae TaxID=3075521 RepID=A0ABU2UT48_9ACTN|nr:hypothetical protein [Streptomyces sp. DSM 41014]MDT0476229.1 hypothetical protein [Streptomyces sp. DSM 41014]
MEPTHHPVTDEALQRLIAQPSFTSQVLTRTADHLDMDPTTPMSEWAGGIAMQAAVDLVLADLPQAVQDEVHDRLARHTPDTTGITRGEAALRLRAAAKDLG